MNTINCNEDSVCVEITDLCYAGCSWCYKKGVVSSKGKPVPLRKVLDRINWILGHIECEDILPIGGEPLTHPNFMIIYDYILASSKAVSIVTSGMISKLEVEQKNLAYALELYEKGLLANFNLSFQPGRNEKAYLSVLKSIKSLYKKNREAREDLGTYHIHDHDLYTTVVFDRSFLGNKRKFIDQINWLMVQSDFTKYGDDDKTINEMFEFYTAHFADFASSKKFNYSIFALDSNLGFRHKFIFRGETTITPTESGHRVMEPKGGTCYAIRTKVEKDTIHFDGLMIRSDGDLCFPTALCIPATSGLCNVDIHVDHEVIFKTIKKSLNQIHKIVFLANRRKAAANCKPDQSEEDCTACPFDDMCNLCHSTVRKW